MITEYIDRPPRNNKGRGKTLLGDEELEAALLTTTASGNAIKLPLAVFHSSPAKGRLHRKGYKVRHRVLWDKMHVGAWVE